MCDRLLAEGQTVVGLDNFLTGSIRNWRILRARRDSRSLAGCHPRVYRGRSRGSHAAHSIARQPRTTATIPSNPSTWGSVARAVRSYWHLKRARASCSLHFGMLWRSAGPPAGGDLPGQRQSRALAMARANASPKRSPWRIIAPTGLRANIARIFTTDDPRMKGGRRPGNAGISRPGAPPCR